MSVIKNIITSDFFVLVVIPVAIIVGVLYICKKYKLSIIPKSLRKKKKRSVKNNGISKGFSMPQLSRLEIDESLGRGKYAWVADTTPTNVRNNENGKSVDEGVKNEDVPFYISASRVTPMRPKRNMYSQ